MTSNEQFQCPGCMIVYYPNPGNVVLEPKDDGIMHGPFCQMICALKHVRRVGNGHGFTIRPARSLT